LSAEYFKLPLKLGEISQKGDHAKCTLKESIAQMIHLIIISHYGECKYDESLGFELWEHDFVTITNTQALKDQLKKSLLRTIQDHEPRLSGLRVDVQLDQVEYRIPKIRTKIMIKVLVNGNIIKTNEQFSFTEQFFIGPLSYY
jgi:phage baseplate assembly protein W